MIWSWDCHICGATCRPCWACSDRSPVSRCIVQDILCSTTTRNFIHSQPTNSPSLTQTRTLNLPGGNMTAQAVSFRSSFQGGWFQMQAVTSGFPMWGSRSRSTPCRFPGNPKTRSRRPWCRSPCRRGSCSRRPAPRCSSSSSSRPRTCRRRTRPAPPSCCKVSGTRKTGRPRCSGRSSLGQNVRSSQGWTRGNKTGITHVRVYLEHVNVTIKEWAGGTKARQKEIQRSGFLSCCFD